jgi:hypothetical protein
MRFSASLLFAITPLGFISSVAAQCHDYWDGVAPWCDGGPCPRGWHAEGTSTYGDGSLCLRGYKVLCKCDLGGTPPDCSQQTRTSCWGLVMFCNNGCGWSPCGVCFGLPFVAQEDGTPDRVIYLSLAANSLTLLRKSLIPGRSGQGMTSTKPWLLQTKYV